MGLREAHNKNFVLRQAAMADLADEDFSMTPMEEFMGRQTWPRPHGFHPKFMSYAVIVSGSGRSAEQALPKGLRADQSLGGIVVTKQPLPLFQGVAPDMPMVSGVAFEIEITAADKKRNNGLAIGFTAQNPDEWSARLAVPVRASHLARSWVCGYSGCWFFERRSKLLRSRPGVQAWQPVGMDYGDVVTAVAVGPPIGLLRIFVNGVLEAEETFSQAQFPDVMDTPVWGIVDLNGSCIGIMIHDPDVDKNLKRSTVNLPGSAMHAIQDAVKLPINSDTDQMSAHDEPEGDKRCFFPS